MGNAYDKAESNEQLALFLTELGRWPDWVVITAFYSALHYVEHALFPVQTSTGKLYAKFEQFYTSEQMNNRGRHSARLQLVRDHLPRVYRTFRVMFDDANEMRYSAGFGTHKGALNALARLALLKQSCL